MTKVELELGMKKCMGVEEFDADSIDKIYNKMDKDKDGGISYEEFLAEADSFCMLLSDQRMHTAFLLID